MVYYFLQIACRLVGTDGGPIRPTLCVRDTKNSLYEVYSEEWKLSCKLIDSQTDGCLNLFTYLFIIREFIPKIYCKRITLEIRTKRLSSVTAIRYSL
jgi:hypothetical protein